MSTMSFPGNGIYVVRGMISTLMTAMRRGSRWNVTSYVDEEKDELLKLFVDLKQKVNSIEDLRLIDPCVYLTPFLEVIRTDQTTGAVTSLALAAINKFLAYGLFDPTSPQLAFTVERIVDAVTHARFMGTDQSSDGVTLFRVVEVLHTLMRSPEGLALTNETVCEVMLSCFKICFESRLNEILRRSAEQALKDMVQLLFMRLPQFSEERSGAKCFKKFQMMAAAMDQSHKDGSKPSRTHKPPLPRRDRKKEEQHVTPMPRTTATNDPQTPQTLTVPHLGVAPLGTTPTTPAGNVLDMQGKITQTPLVGGVLPDNAGNEEETTKAVDDVGETSEEQEEPAIAKENQNSEYVNSVGVRFTHQTTADGSDEFGSLVPYGLPCIQELFRFLILLCNPTDKQNTDTMIHMGLSLLTVAFEVGADNIAKFDTLMELVRDDLCRNLIALLSSERLTIFSANLQLCFLLFESQRFYVKFQMEAYLVKLSEIVASDNPKTTYEMRELALENILQLWRIPGFVAELYINYDCDLYCCDMFENLVKLLSKHTLSATANIYGTHIIAMDALFSVVSGIEKNISIAKDVQKEGTTNGPPARNLPSNNCHSRNNSGLEGVIIDDGGSVPPSEESKVAIENIATFINNSSRMRMHHIDAGLSGVTLTREYIDGVKGKKRVLTTGTELFNQRPDKGIQYLQENGILNTELDPMQIALFLRENPALDKKMIGEYISKKKNVESKILIKFVESFDFNNLRIDEALRLYLESFRLPGEAPLIFLVLEHFADHWHKQNGEPFANTDAAFSLAYAIIMLNMDQHNLNAKRLNVPMTPEDFLKNLRGLNGGAEFNQEMLSTIFNAIKNDEIVMPAEQTGIVRENYLWKVLLRRGVQDSLFLYVDGSAYDLDMFNIIWGAYLSVLSFMFDKSNENGFQHILLGFSKCAAISGHYNLHSDFDGLVLTLCKCTTLLCVVNPETQISPIQNEIAMAVNFGNNRKAQFALRTVFDLVHRYGDCLRDSWRHILDLYLQLFRHKLLPKSLVEVEDFCEANGKVQLILEKTYQKHEVGIFSSLYSYLSSEGQREPSYEEQESIKAGKKCVKECQLEQMFQETKFIHQDSLNELIRCVLLLIKEPKAHKSEGAAYPEDVVVFWMEFLVKVVIHNRDRMISLWPSVRDQIYSLLMSAATFGYDYMLNRSIVGILKLAIYLMRNEELCPVVLRSLKILLVLKPPVIFKISKQISVGIYELLKTSAQNIHSEQDWQIIFTILECVGAGAVPPQIEESSQTMQIIQNMTKSEVTMSSEDDNGSVERGYQSDPDTTESHRHNPHQQHSQDSSPYASSPTTENWILINKDTDISLMSRPQSPPDSASMSGRLASPLVYNCQLIEHSPFALFKCWDSLAFIVRNVAHITPYNFESCVRCIRTFVEACRDGGIKERRKFEPANPSLLNTAVLKKKPIRRRPTDPEGEQKVSPNDSETCDVEFENLSQRYETLSIQLLDLMYTLYTRTAQIFRWWAEEGCAVTQCSALWAQGWCPLLQGIARLANDRRREVRTYAISCLQQRALLVHDLQTLSGAEWALCFRQVLFPLLNELLPQSPSTVTTDVSLLEESRIRIATIMSKVFLHHLTPLKELGFDFNKLWIDILEYIEKFMNVGSDMLSEQMQEILKNMLLVMHSVRVFHNSDGSLHMPLWELTWNRIGKIVPNVMDDLFRIEGSTAQTEAHAPVSDNINIPTVAVLPQRHPDKCFQICKPADGTDLSSPSSPLIEAQHQNYQMQSNAPSMKPDAMEIAPDVVENLNTIPQSTIPVPLVPHQTPTYDGHPTLGETQIQNATGVRCETTTYPEAVTYNQNNCSYAIELPDTLPVTGIFGEQTADLTVHKQYQSMYEQCQSYSEDQQKPEYPFTNHAPSPVMSFNHSSIQPVGNFKVPISNLVADNQNQCLNEPANLAALQGLAPMYVQSNMYQSSELYTELFQHPHSVALQPPHAAAKSSDTERLSLSFTTEPSNT